MTTYTITTTDPAEAQLALDAHKWQRLVRDLDNDMRTEINHTDIRTDTAGWRERLLGMVRDKGLHLYE